MATNKGECIRRLIDDHRLKAVIYLSDDLSDMDASGILRALEGVLQWNNGLRPPPGLKFDSLRSCLSFPFWGCAAE